jgi:hypothetical protein
VSAGERRPQEKSLGESVEAGPQDAENLIHSRSDDIAADRGTASGKRRPLPEGDDALAARKVQQTDRAGS